MKTIEDVRHEENLARFAKLEEDNAATDRKLDTLISDTAGLVEFLKDSKVGLKWSGRVGRFLRTLGKAAVWAFSLYGAYLAWRNGVPK